jgi:hypothetical protein
MRFTAWYAILIGAMMFAQWGFFLGAGLVPELETEPYRIWFHLAAEAVTAAALIASGMGLLQGQPWARPAALLALGMLIYTVIQSPGYFAQQGEWGMVAMFAVVMVLALASVRQLLRSVR